MNNPDELKIEEIQDAIEAIQTEMDVYTHISTNDADELIEISRSLLDKLRQKDEEIQKLREENEQLKEIRDKVIEASQDLLKKKQKLIAGLRYYAGNQYGNVQIIPPIPDIPILHDCGHRARGILLEMGLLED